MASHSRIKCRFLLRRAIKPSKERKHRMRIKIEDDLVVQVLIEETETPKIAATKMVILAHAIIDKLAHPEPQPPFSDND